MSGDRAVCPEGISFCTPANLFAPVLAAFALVAVLCAARVCAAEPSTQTADLSETATLETVVVSGEQPGPGLWKISKGEHVLWILGTLTPLPKKMTWVSREIEATIAESQEVILSPGVSLGVKGGFVRGLFLLPSLLGARNNPDKKMLADVVPTELYARWIALKEKYIGSDRSVEKRRPIFAAQVLYEKAIERSGLSLDDVVSKAVKKAAKRSKVVLVEPNLELRIESPGSAVREFSKSSLDDIDCFAQTITRLETDIEAMKLRGNAWASGDIETMQALPYTDQFQACGEAILSASVVEERGLGNLRTRLAELWLGAAGSALERNRVSFAVLPIRHMFDATGLLAQLRARGYTVEAPE